MPRRAPWFKLDAHWWLTDPGVAVLNEHGERALIRLLCWAWGNGEKPPLLAGDEEQLCRLAKLTPAEWDTCRADVLRLAAIDSASGCYYFPVQMEQWKDMQGKYEQRAEAGKLGGKAKAARTREAPDEPGTAVALHDPVWQRIRDAYPRRRGGQGWREAETRYRSAVKKGAAPSDILAGVEAYARYIRAIDREDTQFVKSAEAWFGKYQGWTEDWTVPAEKGRPGAPAATKAAAQHTRLRGLRDD